jgi:hypothetical protein
MDLNYKRVVVAIHPINLYIVVYEPYGQQFEAAMD